MNSLIYQYWQKKVLEYCYYDIMYSIEAVFVYIPWSTASTAKQKNKNKNKKTYSVLLVYGPV
jgi:hypothetical protein